MVGMPFMLSVLSLPRTRSNTPNNKKKLYFIAFQVARVGTRSPQHTHIMYGMLLESVQHFVQVNLWIYIIKLPPLLSRTHRINALFRSWPVWLFTMFTYCLIICLMKVPLASRLARWTLWVFRWFCDCSITTGLTAVETSSSLSAACIQATTSSSNSRFSPFTQFKEFVSHILFSSFPPRGHTIWHCFRPYLPPRVTSKSSIGIFENDAYSEIKAIILI